MVTKKERTKALFKGIIKSKKTSAKAKASARKGLARLGGSSKKRGNPNGKGTLKQVGRFFGLGRQLGSKAAQTRVVQNAFIAPVQAAAAGAGYAVFEAATLPIALRLKASRLNIPVGASQAVGAWLMAITPNMATKMVGLQGIGIETYSMVSQTETLKRFRVGAANLLNRVLPAGANQ